MSLNKPIWKLRKWIDINKLDWDMLSSNKNAIDFYYKNTIDYFTPFLI